MKDSNDLLDRIRTLAGISNEDDFYDIPLWESAKNKKCTLSDQDLSEVMSMLNESKNQEFEDVWID